MSWVWRRLRAGEPALLAWILGVLSLVFVAGASWLDSTCFFELAYPLRWFIGAIYLGIAWPLLRSKPSRVIAAISLLWMLAVLPQLRWNHAKSFYVDARRLARGMTMDEVRAIMDPHMELGVDELSPEERSWVGEAPDPQDALVFLHCALGWTDHCEVLFDSQGRAREILIVKD
jgi:hypothetical protein